MLREGCIASVRQPRLGLVMLEKSCHVVHLFRALHSCVYVQCVCESNKMHTSTVILVREYGSTLYVGIGRVQNGRLYLRYGSSSVITKAN